ncbi:MAG: GIY-YIG nuclease family protein [Selenomonadaceae bacterium]|nr:GIY-YIG nuclease family protein [Selenomonadaceae bacterium]
MEDQVKDQVQLFNHEKFGQVRLVIIDGRIHFVAADLCRALDIKNPTMAMKQLHEDERAKFNLGLPYGEVNVVNEPGFYRLVFSSRKKEASDFQRWVYHDVLPTINKTGSYSIAAPAISASAMKKALKNPRRRAGQLKDSHVYVVLLSNNTVKIGNASDINERIKQIERKTNLKVLNHHYSPLMSRKSARLMEIYCQKIFSPYKTDGEFFSVNFEATCNAIDIIAKLFDAVSEIERGEKLLAIAEMLTDSPEKQHVLVNSANFIVGSKCD